MFEFFSSPYQNALDITGNRGVEDLDSTGLFLDIIGYTINCLQYKNGF